MQHSQAVFFPAPSHVHTRREHSWVSVSSLGCLTGWLLLLAVGSALQGMGYAGCVPGGSLQIPLLQCVSSRAFRDSVPSYRTERSEMVL